MTDLVKPTLAGFIVWAETAMGITPDILPADSIWFVYAYRVAVEIVDPRMCVVSPTIYMLAVYNLGGSNLINFAHDAPDAEPYKNNLPYFEYFRDKWNILGPVSGVVSSAADQGTATSLEVPQALKDLTLADLAYMKTPWGRQYLQFAQSQGTLWGLT